MNKLVVAASVISILSTFACSASSGSLVDVCSGRYRCNDGTATTSTELQKSGGACTAGQLTLNQDGTVGGTDGATWTGTENGFSICASDGCLVCTPEPSSDPRSPDSGRTGQCVGTAKPCNEQAPPDCDTEQRGCVYQEEIGPAPGYDVTSVCTGTPIPCDSITEPYVCGGQKGCAWTY